MTLRFGIAQVACGADPEANMAGLVETIDELARRGADVVALPEMSDTGYAIEDIRVHAARWTGEGSRVDALRSAARDAGVNVAAGLSEEVNGQRFNSVIAIDRSGRTVGHYRKIHLFRPLGEHEVISAGDRPVIVEFDGVPMSLSICFDLRFPELYRSAYSGVSVHLVASAWPAARRSQWETLVRARALDTQSYVVAANRVGTDAGITFAGTSTVITPTGEPLVELDGARAELRVVDVNLDAVREFREQIPVHELRRPDVYGADWTSHD